MSPAARTDGAFGQETRVIDFIALLKPRVASLVAFTGFVGLWLADSPLHPFLAATAVLAIALGAGGAGAVNMWYEVDIDARMERTRNRPIPAGRMSRSTALGYGVVTCAAAVFILALATNYVAAFLLAVAELFYIFVYTIWLKRRTPQNIVVGGVAGALPPLIGWAAATGGVDLFPALLFALIFMWTPPHFWALSLYKAGDYARAGVPMLPVVAGPDETRRQIVLYAAALIPFALAPWALGFAGAIYGVGAALLGSAFFAFAFALRRRASVSLAKATFAYSILYLFLMFALLVFDHAWNR
ncbi:MAG: protoheme IX farnesyltransferase [Alphaproteobacteria bacterium]|nr:protoheme IX farnesyltransferase [Alphaproteobacteria bacterium]